MVASIPPYWDQWIYASIANHFDAYRQGVYMYVEGFPRETDDKSEWFECRIDGPFYDGTTNGQWIVDVEINIAICVVMNNNAYRPHQLAGIMANAFTFSIPVNRRGDASENPVHDGTLLGCLHLKPGDRERIDKSFFGKVRPDTELMQASLEGHYRMYLSA